MKIGLFLLFIVLVLLNLDSQAQTPEQTLDKVFETITKSKYLYYENEYIYHEVNSKSTDQKIEGVFHRHGDQAYFKMGPFECLNSEGWAISTDHDEKLVTIAQSSMPKMEFDGINPLELQGALDQREVSIEFIDSRAGINGLKIVDLNKSSTVITLYYQPVTWLIQEVRFEQKNDSQIPWLDEQNDILITVKYLNVTTVPKNFNYRTSQYLKRNDSGFVATGKCKGYQIIQ